MPLYMDIHHAEGATAEAVGRAHIADLEIQQKYGVEFTKYGFSESCGKIFCLVNAPSSEAGGVATRGLNGLG